MNEKSTILIVEDEEINRGILKFMLQDQFNIVEAANGEEGLKVLKSFLNLGIAAVLLDLVMPEKDGFYFLEEYKNSDELKKIPVIVSTMSYDSETETKCLRMGVWDFVRKPYNADIIKSRIKNCIDRSELYVLKELKYQEDYDSLTDVYKKGKFFRETRKLLDEYSDKQFAFMRFDIHKFQLINLFYGVDEGDKLIKYLADCIAEDAKYGLFDTYGRIESDIFCMCGRYTGKSSIKKFVDHVQEKIDDFGLDFEVLPVFGIYVIEDNSMPINDMYDKTILASKRCKGNYLENYCFYDDNMSSEIVKEQVIVNNMNNALATGQFELYLQPKYELKQETLEGAEVLIRWNDPERGMISPGEFIPVFERNGFILRLDCYVWEQTCILLKRWIDEGKNVFPVSVNISRISMYNPKLVDIIFGLVTKYNIPPYLLQLELTESAYNNNPTEIIKTMKKLQDKGFVVLMDDFGSGYSSLNVLKDITVDILKIDMKFLSDSGSDKTRGEIILASVVRMAKWLNMPVIAEGVEEKEQVEFLRSIDCESVQGYYFAKPMPVVEYEKLAFPENMNNCGGNILDDSARRLMWDTSFSIEENFAELKCPAVVCEYDGKNIEIIRANREYFNLFGYSDINNSNSNFIDTVYNNDKEHVLDTFKDVVFPQNIVGCQFIKKLESGGSVWVNMSLQSIGKIGTSTVIFATLKDIADVIE